MCASVCAHKGHQGTGRVLGFIRLKKTPRLVVGGRLEKLIIHYYYQVSQIEGERERERKVCELVWLTESMREEKS